jgi:LysM repeat protein
MGKSKNYLMLSLVVVLLIAGIGPAAQPAQAATCAYYHYVTYGESLSSIGAAYGVNWKDIASANGISSPYTIYPFQRLCIPSASGTGGTYGTGGPYTYTGWSYRVIRVNPGTSVTIQTYNLPDNVIFNAAIGCWGCGGAPTNVTDFDTGAGGTINLTFDIPASLANTYQQLYLRITQVKKGKYLDLVFGNVAGQYGTGGPYTGTYVGVPTITIVSAVRNTSVTIATHNFPTNLIFDVLMGPMGSRGVGGYVVGTIDSANGSDQTLTFNIPSQLAGSYQIAIRTQNTATGYFSYNWFYN